ncbi:MAG TPA: hypothetical protein VFT99_02185, partial [Roseiflexaceae bacterium]|nr:hypothetical protein [Roseiflexaceae bacterium]
GWAVNGGAADWWEQVLPIRNNGINYAVKSGYLNWTSSVTGSSGQHSLIQNLNSRWILENVFPFFFGGEYTGARHVYGWVPSGAGIGGHADMPVYPHAGGLGVVGIGTDTPGTNTDNPGAGALIFGHELTHDYDVKHTDVSGDCGSDDDTSPFPYSSASIQEFGFNTITGKVYDPATTHDLMSYCPAGGSKLGWISPYTWEFMWNKLRVGPASAAAEVDRGAPASGILAVDVTVTNPALGPQTGVFDTLAKVDNEGPVIMPTPGEYSIELRGAGNTTLSSTPFAISFVSEYSAHDGDHPGDPTPTAVASSHMSIPWIDGTTQVVLLHGATVLQSRTVSATPPSVQFTNPTTAQTWAAGTTQTLSWAGSDADPGTTLTYSLFYSADGVQWDLIADHLTATSYDVEVDSLAGSPVARFRVVANDGVLIGEDETNAPISVPNKAPNAVIVNPGPNSQVPIGDLLVLQGTASDLEDGDLPESALLWSSDKQGNLGSGSELPINNLQPGLHVITLTVTDSNGQTSTATVSVYIGYLTHLPLIIKP